MLNPLAATHLIVPSLTDIQLGEDENLENDDSSQPQSTTPVANGNPVETPTAIEVCEEYESVAELVPESAKKRWTTHGVLISLQGKRDRRSQRSTVRLDRQN
jgi:hypothetical protein